MSKPLFITLEGGEGGGKSTQARRLKAHLESQGREVVLTREPGGTPEAEKIRDLLVQRDGGRWTPMAECALFFAARQMHIEHVIKPALADKKTVICDRFTDSTRAYQGYGHGFDLENIERMNRLVTNNFQPDLTFIFDIEPWLGLNRSLKQNSQSLGREMTEDRFEKMDLSFHERLRHGFLEIAKNNPHRCRVIDASQSEDHVFQSIRQVIDAV